MTRCAAITGPFGYLGSMLRDRLEAEGWLVIPLSRRAQGHPGARHFDLSEPCAPDLLHGVDVVVHCAYDFTLSSYDDIWRVNVEGTRRLLELARSHHTRALVLSSMSAYEGTRQRYGRAKLEIERLTLAAGGHVVRPGLVIGPSPGGMAGSLAKLSKLPVTPTILGAGRQFPVYEKDFTDVVVALAQLDAVSASAIGIAQSEAVDLRTIQVVLAEMGGRRAKRFVGIPWPVVYGVLRLGEWLRVPLPFRADSLLGLVHPASDLPSQGFLAEHGIALPGRVA